MLQSAKVLLISGKLFEHHFFTESRARTMHLRNMLQSPKKESFSINEYVLKMKEFSDSLYSSGVHISTEDLIAYILDGLGPEYDAIVANLSSRSDLTIQEVQFYLHKHEMRIERHSAIYGGMHEQSHLAKSAKIPQSNMKRRDSNIRSIEPVNYTSSNSLTYNGNDVHNQSGLYGHHNQSSLYGHAGSYVVSPQDKNMFAAFASTQESNSYGRGRGRC
ncbi:hypothetical protein Patl1_09761 [Pistacia atlantica]|uniref:Uncharacterized protein n=1 Tax=Pistacia atlantica TaxID=434234 RepID=A0ACC1A2Z2_9ROSI|nr:hypothetical protein Patl1_09761 [Pistacia atlantica]